MDLKYANYFKFKENKNQSAIGLNIISDIGKGERLSTDGCQVKLAPRGIKKELHSDLL